MFIRIIVGVLAISFGLGTVMAQQDPVKTREDLMKKNNDYAKAIVQMMRGQLPFDAAAVDAAFKQWADTAQSLADPIPRKFQDRRRKPRVAEDLDRTRRISTPRPRPSPTR